MMRSISVGVFCVLFFSLQSAMVDAQEVASIDVIDTEAINVDNVDSSSAVSSNGLHTTGWLVVQPNQSFEEGSNSYHYIGLALDTPVIGPNIMVKAQISTAYLSYRKYDMHRWQIGTTVLPAKDVYTHFLAGRRWKPTTDDWIPGWELEAQVSYWTPSALPKLQIEQIVSFNTDAESVWFRGRHRADAGLLSWPINWSPGMEVILFQDGGPTSITADVYAYFEWSILGRFTNLLIGPGIVDLSGKDPDIRITAELGMSMPEIRWRSN